MRRADNLPPYRAVVMKSGSLNFLEPSGPAQACYGRTLLLLLSVVYDIRQQSSFCGLWPSSVVKLKQYMTEWPVTLSKRSTTLVHTREHKQSHLAKHIV